MADNQRTRREQLAIENALRDAKAVEAGKAYERSLTNTPPAPMEPASAPKLPPVKKAKGGYVKAADGICKRGRTKGKVV